MTIAYGAIALVTGLLYVACRWSSGAVMAVTTAPFVGSLAVIIVAILQLTAPYVLAKCKHTRHNTNTGIDRTTH